MHAAFLFFHASSETPLKDRKIDPIALLELTKSLGLEVDLVVETQKHWLRTQGKERREIQELDCDQKKLY